MSIIINTNISSMLGVMALNKNTNAMNKALERLSTGCRINSSKDDAAGCAISTSLTKEVSSLNVAQSNAQMGQSLIDTANGALSNMSNMLQRIRDLAEQSANGTYGADERKAMQSEVNNLVSELYRTKNSTEFNGKQILGTESTHPITEEEAIAEGYTTVHTAQELKEAITTSADCKVMLFADINLDDLETVDGSNWTTVSDFKGTFDGNGFTISNLTINSIYSKEGFIAETSSGAVVKNVALENVNVTGKSSIGGVVSVNGTGATVENCSVSGTVNGSSQIGGVVGYNYGTIENCTSSATVTSTGITGIAGGIVGYSYSSSGTIVRNCSSSGTVSGYSQVGGIAGRMSSGTIENCTTVATVTSRSGNSTGAVIGKSSSSILLSENEYNSAVNEGMPAVGSGFDDPTEDEIRDNPNLVFDPFANPDTAFSLQVGIDNEDTSVIDINTGFKMGLFNVNISTEAGARSALNKLDAMLSKVTQKQTELGAASSRLDSAMQYQQIQRNTKIATNSIIKDADFAAESSNYIKQQILQQTTSSLLSTANQNPNIALMLLNSQRR